ncbi:MAG: hypothetical protein ACJ8AI_00055, partial [Rhodopila sp.]
MLSGEEADGSEKLNDNRNISLVVVSDVGMRASGFQAWGLIAAVERRPCPVTVPTLESEAQVGRLR